MKMDKVAGSGNDEFYTPIYAIKPILEFIPTGSKVWLPFDTIDSQYIELLKEHGCKVINTHIEDGDDFFSNTRDIKKAMRRSDYIISNPPYSLKNEVFERLFKIGKPFAMLVGVVGLFESQKRFEMFRDNNFEVMYMNRRVSYFKDYTNKKPDLNPPFSSVYLCSKLLPEKIIFREIDKSDI